MENVRDSESSDKGGHLLEADTIAMEKVTFVANVADDGRKGKVEMAVTNDKIRHFFLTLVLELDTRLQTCCFAHGRGMDATVVGHEIVCVNEHVMRQDERMCNLNKHEHVGAQCLDMS